MADEEYYTTDTRSVAREIDVSDVNTGDENDDDDWRFEWKRPAGYLLLVLLVILAVLLTVFWLGLDLPVVT